MLSNMSTLFGAVFGIAAMVAAILREGPMWIQITGAVVIAVLLVSGSLINGTARDSIDRIDDFLSDVDNEPSSATNVVMLVRDDDLNDEDEDEDDASTRGQEYH